MLTDHRGQFARPSSFSIASAAFSRADSVSGVGVVVDMFLGAVSRTKWVRRIRTRQPMGNRSAGQAYTCAVEMYWAYNLLLTARPEDGIVRYCTPGGTIRVYILRN